MIHFLVGSTNHPNRHCLLDNHKKLTYEILIDCILGKGIEELVGILIGHMYFFLSFKYPQDFGGPSLLATPNILYSWFPNKRGVSGKE